MQVLFILGYNLSLGIFFFLILLYIEIFSLISCSDFLLLKNTIDVSINLVLNDFADVFFFFIFSSRIFCGLFGIIYIFLMSLSENSHNFTSFLSVWYFFFFFLPWPIFLARILQNVAWKWKLLSRVQLFVTP